MVDLHSLSLIGLHFCCIGQTQLYDTSWLYLLWVTVVVFVFSLYLLYFWCDIESGTVWCLFVLNTTGKPHCFFILVSFHSVPQFSRKIVFSSLVLPWALVCMLAYWRISWGKECVHMPELTPTAGTCHGDLILDASWKVFANVQQIQG